MTRVILRAVLLAAVLVSGASPLHAIPAFARKYRVSCAMCHSPVPALNVVGEKFAANGFEFAPGEQPRDTIDTGDPLLRLQSSLPLAIRYDAYLQGLTPERNGQISADVETPWVIKLLSGGQVAPKISYYAYFLLSERGEVGGLEDAYIQFTDLGGLGVSLIAGQFQVSDPLFKRELRLSYEDYQPYRLRVGEAASDLTYERGVMLLGSPWTGGDVSLQVVSGRGLNAASGARQYDRDDPKNLALRVSQEIGFLRVGVFGYRGVQKDDGARNRTYIWGPDATVEMGERTRLNIQYLRRVDDDPFFGACSIASPCPGNMTTASGTTVDAGLAEMTFSPQGPSGRLTFTGLVNWIESSRPVISLRLGEQEQEPGYFTKYRTATGGVHYLLRRNVRLMTEAGYDWEHKQTRLTSGFVLAF